MAFFLMALGTFEMTGLSQEASAQDFPQEEKEEKQEISSNFSTIIDISLPSLFQYTENEKIDILKLEREILDIDATLLWYKKLPDIGIQLQGFPILPAIYAAEDDLLSSVPDYSIDWTKWQSALGLKLSLQIPIATFGRFSAGQKLMDFKKKSQDLELENKKQENRYLLKRLYWTYLYLKTLEDGVFQQIMPEYREWLQNLEKKKDAEYTEAYLFYTELLRKQEDLQKEFQLLESEIRKYLWVPGDRRIYLQSPVSRIYSIPLDIPDSDFLLSKAWEQNPASLRVQNMHLVKEFEYRLAKANTLPILGLGVFLDWNILGFKDTKEQYDPLFLQRSPVFGLGFELKWNLNFWEQQSQREKIRLQQQKDILEQEALIYDLSESFRQKYILLISSEKQKNILESAAQKSQQELLMKLKNKAWEGGDSSTLLKSYKQWIQSQVDAHTSLWKFYLNLSEMEYLIGSDILDYESIEKAVS